MEKKLSELTKLSQEIARLEALKKRRKAWIRKLYAEGMNVSSICKILNAKGNTIARQAVYKLVEGIDSN